MGKAKKLKALKSKRNNPLEQQLLESELPKQSVRVKVRNRRDEDEEFVDNKLSKKILEQAREQQEELEEEFEYSSAYKLSSKLEGVSLRCEDAEEVSESDEDEDSCVHIPSSAPDIEISQEDKKALELFMNKDSSVTTSLREIIKEKLTEKETELQSEFSDVGSLKLQNIEKLVPIYRGVAEVLAHYRSGKIPKAFKTIPSLRNWEQVLYLTEPDNWSSAAVYQATRIFASNLKEQMAQRFYNLVLLPRLRDDIAQCKTLNFHLYQSLRKSLFKPGAFFKGIVLPLCEKFTDLARFGGSSGVSKLCHLKKGHYLLMLDDLPEEFMSGTCTLREATIIGSVISKYSIPGLHSSTAIMKLADMDYTGANSIFLRVLLEKKYALPFRTVDAVVAHFLRFALDKRELPLLWHQCLLTFAQHYKNDISTEQQESLLSMLCAHSHPEVTPEIRRELLSGKCRHHNTVETESKCEI